MFFRNLFDLVGPFREDLFSGGDAEWCHRAQTWGAKLIYAPDVVVRHQVVHSWRSFVKRYRRKAGGNYLLKTKKMISRGKVYQGFNPKPFGLHPLCLLHAFIKGIQKFEDCLCQFGKTTIRGQIQEVQMK